MDRKKNKNSNAGMTLLEVIIAVSIFSITAIVLLQSFVTSSRINKKSNTYLEATSTAQNVMEEIKAKRFKEIALAFNYPLDRSGNSRFTFLQPQVNDIGTSLDIREVLKLEDGTYTDVRQYRDADGDDDTKVTASVISHDSGKSYKFNANKTDKYYYTMTNVKTLHDKFDVLVEFDGSQDSGYKKKTVANNEYGKNDYLSPNITKLDSKKNAFLIMEKNWDENAMNELITKQCDYARTQWGIAKSKWETDNPEAEAGAYEAMYPEPQRLSEEEVYAHTRRVLKVKLEKSGGGIVVKAKYILSMYDYSANSGSGYETMSICPCGNTSFSHTLEDDSWQPGESCFCTYSSPYTAIYGSENESDLQSVYIFYYPNYNSTNQSKPLDEIYFDNSQIEVKDGNATVNYPVNLYVTKQRDEKNNEPTQAQELGYRMALTVTESPTKPWTANKGLFRASTVLLTNLDYDISNKDIAERTKTTQMKLTYQDKKGSKTTDYSAKTILSYNGLDNKIAENRIYSAVVKVYKQGAAAENFPDSDLIVSLDGAKEN